MKNLKDLKEVSDIFFEKCDSLVAKKPWLVCIAMHEYFRNIWPDDPYIPFPEGICHSERIYEVTKGLISFVERSDCLGNYDIDPGSHISDMDVKKKTGQVYGSFWKRFFCRKEGKGRDGSWQIEKRRKNRRSC